MSEKYATEIDAWKELRGGKILKGHLVARS